MFLLLYEINLQLSRQKYLNSKIDGVVQVWK